MMTVYEIKLVLEAHASLCMDNERERARLAVALHKAMEEDEAAAKPKRKVKK